MTFYDDFRKIYDEYLDYLQDNPPIELPYKKHDPELSVGKVHASSLGRCPLASAKSRKEKVKHDFSTKHLMEQGKRDASPLQEAAYWKGHSVEVSVEREHLRGRLDILMNNNVVEIKRRDIGYSKEGRPLPKLSDVYQMLAYSWITRLPDIYLLLVTRFDLYFWKLIPRDTGFVLVDEQGEEWKSYENQPSYLNYGVLMAESKEHLSYMNGEKIDDPIPNFLNVSGGIECYHHQNKDRPKQYKDESKGKRNAFIAPHCSFFSSCKGITIPESGLIEIEEIGYDTKTYGVVEHA